MVEIVIHSPYKNIKIKDTINIKEKVYNILINNGINTDTSLDCAVYCEVANEEDSYTTNEFDVYIDND